MPGTVAAGQLGQHRVVGRQLGIIVAVRGAIHSNSVRFFDSLVGVAVQLVVVLVAAWMLATPLTSSSGQPSLAAAVRGSRVLRQVNDYAPDWLKTVPKRLSSLLVAVATPDSALANNPVVANTEPSVVKIRAIAPGCQKVLEGSGFVLSPDRVMTNAHVVAGANSVTVEASGNPYDATVVSYDPTVDIAILSVPNLPSGPLAFSNAPVTSGTEAIVMGYPGGGGFMATPARIRELITLNGPDIYRSATINREVYTVRANVEQGNSGGPLIDLNGQVLGVVFGAAVDDNDTGFVLTAKEVAAQLAHIGDTAPVSTGACVS